MVSLGFLLFFIILLKAKMIGNYKILPSSSFIPLQPHLCAPLAIVGVIP